jgi:hypothetical protein
MVNHSRLGLAITAAQPWIVSDSASGSNTSWPNRITVTITIPNSMIVAMTKRESTLNHLSQSSDERGRITVGEIELIVRGSI